MTTVFDLATLSAAVYDDCPIIEEWETIQCFSTKVPKVLGIRVRKGGFFACLFRHKAHKEFVFAVRGTDDPGPDLRDDTLIALATISLYQGQQLGTTASIIPQFQEALTCMSAVMAHTGSREFYFTGHSLGGGIAVMLAALYQHPVVTFNAPGMAYLQTTIGRSLWWTRRDDLRMMHIRSSRDPVSMLTPRNPGNQRLVKVACTFDRRQLMVKRMFSYLLGQHGIEGLKLAIKNEKDLNKPLDWLRK